MNAQKLGKLIAEEITNDDALAVYIGSFKPPHKAHWDVAQEVASLPYTTEVIVLIGQKERDGVTVEMSKKIWDIYLECQPNPKIKVTISANPSPIKDIFSYLTTNINDSLYITTTVGEEEDQGYINSLKQSFDTRIKAIDVEEKFVTDGKRLSGTTVRGYIAQLKEEQQKMQTEGDKTSNQYQKAKNQYLSLINILEGCFPDAVIQKGYFEQIMNILGVEIIPKTELQESIYSQSSQQPFVDQFVKFCCELLEIKTKPEITILDEPIVDGHQPSFGAYFPDDKKILVCFGGRHIMDSFRTLAHELVHQAQRETGNQLNGNTGSEIENEANASAAMIMRKWGQLHPELF